MTITVGNIERNYFTKQPWERKIFTIDFSQPLGSGVTASECDVNATDASGTSVNTTILSGTTFTRAGIVTIGVKAGTSGKIYTITSQVSAAAYAPSGANKRYEADIFMRVSEIN